LVRLREHLPSERPLTGVQLASEGGAVVVRDGGARWDADSGQMLIDFDGQRRDGAPDGSNGDAGDMAPIALSTARRPAPAPTDGAAVIDTRAAVPANASDLDDVVDGAAAPAAEPSVEDLYELACSLEEAAPEAARAAYQRVLALAPRHADAHVNLGRLMHEAGDLQFADEHYRAALRERPTDPVALYNLGVVLEDVGRTDEALDQYEAALAADPANADGHFNAARLYERTGRYEAALRHLRAYRNLTANKRT
jgi:lipoprotein NlpI